MRIFVVDDELALMNKLKKSASKVYPDAEVLAFQNPLIALETAESKVPDIVLTDIEMPTLNGVVFASKLKELNKLTKIIFCTAYSDYAIKAFELHANGYLLKPYSEEDIKKELENALMPSYLPYQKRVLIKTFGNFDVFVDGKIVPFTRNRSKEILAYLVSKKGSEVSSEELAAIIWDDEEYDKRLKKQLYVYIGDLKADLAQYNIENIFIKTKNGYSVDINAFDCDYYRLLNGDLAIINEYEGEFMSQYSWGELINSYLENNF